jgi:hypothetical protein
MFFAASGRHRSKYYLNHRESETPMALNFQNIFHQIKALKIRILLTSLGIVFFLYMGTVVGYFYYLSP